MTSGVDLLAAYEQMYLIRTAETAMARHYLDARIFSFVHFCVGQEAVAVGVSRSLLPDDKALGNHRSHGHYLAKGGNLFGMFSEMLGKSTGCCRGKGGSMHMLDRSVNFMGSTPILASGVPIASGLAMAEKFRASNNVVVVYLGDGASEEGVVYETMNFAAVKRLPLLFVLEDNLYSVNTPHKVRRSPDFDLRQMVEGLGVLYFEADGNSYQSVRSVSARAVKVVRDTNKPAMIRCKVFRHLAHSSPLMDDHMGYRAEDRLEVRESRDCVFNLRSDLLAKGKESTVRNIEAEVELNVHDSLEAAVVAPEPEQHELHMGVTFG